MIMDRAQLIQLILILIGTGIQQSGGQLTSSLHDTIGKTVTLECALTGSYTYPEWRGPPSLTVYTNQGDNTGQINQAAPAASRLSYAANNQDLILTNAEVADSGDYTCTHTSIGVVNTITLTVTAATTTTTEVTTPTTSTTSTTTSTTSTTTTTTTTTPTTSTTTTTTPTTSSTTTPTTTTTTTGSSTDNTVVIISVTTAVGFILIVVAVIVVIALWRKQKGKRPHLGDHEKGYQTPRSVKEYEKINPALRNDYGYTFYAGHYRENPVYEGNQVERKHRQVHSRLQPGPTYRNDPYTISHTYHAFPAQNPYSHRSTGGNRNVPVHQGSSFPGYMRQQHNTHQYNPGWNGRRHQQLYYY